MPSYDLDFDCVNDLITDLNDASSVFSYLTASANTTITDAVTWYPINGTFDNQFINFELDTDKIKYIGDRDYIFEIDWHAKLASDTAGATVNVTVAINGTAVESSKMGVFLKFAGEPASVSGTEIVEITNGDTIQLVCQTDKDGSVLTFGQFVTSLNKFVIKRV